MQHVGFCALPTGQVVVSSRWEALDDITAAELADYTFYWLDIPGWLPKRSAKQLPNATWSIDDKLQMQVLGSRSGKIIEGGVLGAVGRDFTAKKGDTLLDTVCLYQSILPGRPPITAGGDPRSLKVGNWLIRRGDDQRLHLAPASSRTDNALP